ncbi:MAG: hypothetical protein L0Y79_10750 [Chlorobi bacterium]|nr:hypothetical protein [Chlorobiota bacterium]MCI0715304.1 hypothetical protein [Chlorobiota bacterium]
MTTTTLKKRINRTIKKLPKEKLQVVDDFVSYLADRDEENEATKELMAIPGLLSELEKAQKEFKEGKGVNWRKVPKDV